MVYRSGTRCAKPDFSLSMSSPITASREQGLHDDQPFPPDHRPVERHGGRPARQCRQGPQGVGGREGRRRRHAGPARDVHHRIPDAGSGSETRLLPPGRGGDPGTCRPLHRRPGPGDRRAVARRRKAVQRVLGLQGRRDDRPRPEAPPAPQAVVRRMAAVQQRPDQRSLSRRGRADRIAHLRGQLVPRRGRDAGRNRGRDPDRAQRIALSQEQAGPAHGPHGRPRGRNRAAAGLCQHGGRAGRPALRRRQLRAEPRRPQGRAASAVPGDAGPCGFHPDR